MNKLQEQLMKAAQQYYSDGSSSLSDEQFDSLTEQLKEQDPDNPILSQVGFGYDVNKDPTPGNKIKHKYGVAGSLSKAYNWKELNTDLTLNEIHASLKLDGLSTVLYYVKGHLDLALTRGDGVTGIAITDKIYRILPDSIKDRSFTGAVRGEIIMTQENFTKFKEIHPEAKNPRNSAAGIISSKDISEDLQYLDIVVYTQVGDESTEYSHTYRRNIQSWLQSNFDKVAPWDYIWIDETNYLDTLQELKARWYGLYPADGIVLSDMVVAHNVQTGELIYKSQAFKFPAETAVAEVTDIEWNLSKTRYLVPKVKIQTVQLSGTNVSAATGFNAKFIKDNSIGVGSSVEIEKHGEIIPCINRVITSTDADLPTTCPECGHNLVWQGVHLACPNTECQNAATQDLLVWLNALVPTDGLGDTLKLKFAQQTLCKDVVTVEDIMAACKDTEYLANLQQASQTSIQLSLFYNMMTRLASETFSLSKAIQALNVPRFGEITADKLSQHSEAVRKLLDGTYEWSVECMLLCCSNIGQADAVSWIANLGKVNRLNLIDDRIDWTDKQSIKLRGKVAITGKLSVKRSQFEAELRKAGFSVSDVSSDTMFLITDNPNSNSSKNAKADKLGVRKITESEFRNKYL